MAVFLIFYITIYSSYIRNLVFTPERYKCKSQFKASLFKAEIATS